MLNEAKKFVEEANELKKLCMKIIVEQDALTDADPEAIILCMKMCNLVDTSMNMVLEQAKLFDQMDEKLDKLLYYGKQKIESK